MKTANTITVAQAAALLGRSERWVQEIAKAGYIRKAEPGRYAVAAVIQGAIAYYEARIEKSRKGAAARGATDARTREIELRIADRMKDLIHQADVTAVVEGIRDLVQQEFSGLPARFTRDRQGRRALGREVAAALGRVDEAVKLARRRITTGFDE